MSDLQTRYQQVRESIDSACLAANRKPDEVTLIVVTKNHPQQLVLDLLDLGHRDFGENRDQEAAPKAEFVAANTSLSMHEYRWHFIGQLQSNKAKSVLKYAHAIHSLDRPSLLEALNKETHKIRQSQPGFEIGVFIQLNLTDDPNRGGIQSANLSAFTEQVLEVDGLTLMGVMGVASLDGELERDFAQIQAASQQVQLLAPAATSISAGMSDDYQVALKYGATHLRIGTAITGKRVY